MFLLYLFFLALQSVTPGERGVQFQGKDFGQAIYKEKRLPFIEAFGSLLLERVTVEQDVQVMGSLKAEQLEVGNDLEVKGQALLHQVVVKGTTLVSGYVKATSSQFLQRVDVYGNEAIFDGCVLESLVVHAKWPDKLEPRVIFRNGTRVEKEVVFAEKVGELLIEEEPVDTAEYNS